MTTIAPNDGIPLAAAVGFRRAGGWCPEYETGDGKGSGDITGSHNPVYVNPFSGQIRVPDYSVSSRNVMSGHNLLLTCRRAVRETVFM